MMTVYKMVLEVSVEVGVPPAYGAAVGLSSAFVGCRSRIEDEISRQFLAPNSAVKVTLTEVVKK